MQTYKWMGLRSMMYEGQYADLHVCKLVVITLIDTLMFFFIMDDVVEP